MRELLERWARLEPERCGISEHAAHLGKPFAFRIHWAVLGADPINLAVVLAAAIEAIEARGWDCRLTSNQLREGDWHAVVWVGGRLPRFRQPRPSLDGFGPTPAVALLGAYLAALEAEEGAQ